MIWRIRRAFGVRGKFHPASLWLDIPYGKTHWTLEARNSGFFHLSKCHLNHIDKRTSRSFMCRENICFSNEITFWCTLPHTRLRGFGSNLWHGQCRTVRRGFLRCLDDGRRLRHTALRWCALCIFCFGRLFPERLKLLCTFALMECYGVFASSRLHLQTQPLGRMRHSPSERIFCQTGPFLDQGRCDSINQPILQDPDAPDAAFGKPAPAGKQRTHINLKRNPFQQILQSRYKGSSFRFVFHMIAGKMNISSTTCQLPAGIAKTEEDIGASQNV